MTDCDGARLLIKSTLASSSVGGDTAGTAGKADIGLYDTDCDGASRSAVLLSGSRSPRARADTSGGGGGVGAAEIWPY